MTTIQTTPELHHIFNEFDRIGVLLGLSRLTGEDNISYKHRLMDVFVNRANSTYRGLINGITRELGFSLTEILKIIPIVDANGQPLVTMPAIVFQDTKCYLYNDYENNDILLTIDRFEKDEGAWTIGELVSTINNTGKYLATILDTDKTNIRSMSIFNQSSIEVVEVEDISGVGGQYHLNNNNLIRGTVAITSPNLTRRVNSISSLSTKGDYYIDLPNGIVFILGQAAPGSLIRYNYRNDEFIALSSPIIIHNLQSEDFQTKMFEQITLTDGTVVNSKPTLLGTNLINELLSVYPSSWGI